MDFRDWLPGPGEYLHDTGAKNRYEERRKLWAWSYYGRYKHDLHWLLHNCVVHPKLGAAAVLDWYIVIAPGKLNVSRTDNRMTRAVREHGISSAWLHNRDTSRETDEDVEKPKVKGVARTAWWVLHNCVAHPLIGLFPKDWAFALHDRTAAKMDVDGWV